jgi:hypothetical protein
VVANLAEPQPVGNSRATLTSVTTPPFGPYEPQQQGPPGQWQPGGYGQYAPPPPAPPPKKKTGLVLVIVVIALLLIGGGVAGIYLLRKDDTSAASKTTQSSESVPASPAPDPGVCIKFTSPTLTNPEVAELGCDDPEAAYKVAKRLDKASGSCPSDDYDSYRETGVGEGYKLCLMINGQEGACFDDLDSTSLPTKRADCATAGFKVIKAVDGEADESACPTDDTVASLTYPEPPNTVCVKAT